jgi:16S rRNA (cytidine1402-2'-O)-methyltransferase
MSGVLYVVATPIGNLEDMTFRAVRILREVDRIACEDTRQTRKLLDHYGISTPAVSYHEHNEQARSDELIRDLEAGRNIALVSDAGTPLIADPGYRVVEKARERGISVVPLPGASALLAALSASGLPTDHFAFLGFLPPKSGQRRKALLEGRELRVSLVFFETPHRIQDALEDLAEIFPGTTVVLARELTKIHEEFLRGTAAELRALLANRDAIKGEFTVMVAKYEPVVDESRSLDEEVAALISSGVDRMEALKEVARRRGLSKREVYKQVRSQV